MKKFGYLLSTMLLCGGCLFGCDLSADDINQIIDNIDNIEISINEDKDKEVEPEIEEPQIEEPDVEVEEPDDGENDFAFEEYNDELPDENDYVEVQPTYPEEEPSVTQQQDVFEMILNSGIWFKETSIDETTKTMFITFDSNDVTLKYACDSMDTINGMIATYGNGEQVRAKFEDVNPDNIYNDDFAGFSVDINNGSEDFKMGMDSIEEYYTDLVDYLLDNGINPNKTQTVYTIGGMEPMTSIYPNDPYGRIEFRIYFDLREGESNTVNAQDLYNRILLENTGLYTYAYVVVRDNDGNILEFYTNDSDQENYGL